jgi:hypothetical protein
MDFIELPGTGITKSIQFWNLPSLVYALARMILVYFTALSSQVNLQYMWQFMPMTLFSAVLTMRLSSTSLLPYLKRLKRNFSVMQSGTSELSLIGTSFLMVQYLADCHRKDMLQLLSKDGSIDCQQVTYDDSFSLQPSCQYHPTR